LMLCDDKSRIVAGEYTVVRSEYFRLRRASGLGIYSGKFLAGPDYHREVLPYCGTHGVCEMSSTNKSELGLRWVWLKAKGPDGYPDPDGAESVPEGEYYFDPPVEIHGAFPTSGYRIDERGDDTFDDQANIADDENRDPRSGYEYVQTVVHELCPCKKAVFPPPPAGVPPHTPGGGGAGPNTPPGGGGAGPSTRPRGNAGSTTDSFFPQMESPLELSGWRRQGGIWVRE
jgi:hypothetical protein